MSAVGNRLAQALVESLTLAAFSLLPLAGHADQLGRLFTTPEQRHELDMLRYAQIETAKHEPSRKTTQSKEEGKPAQAATPITIRGVVTRSNGENAAWINNSNSFEGNPASGAIRVTPGEIHGDKVKIVMPDGSTSVNVKVGETYEPEARRVVDLLHPDPQPPTATGDSGSRLESAGH